MTGNGSKPSNPKDALGILKVPFSTIPAPVLAEIGVGMYEGARKYGRHNFRVIGVRASVYYDAAIRHLTAWWEGEDIDPDSGLPHIVKALTSLIVLRDAIIQTAFVDDRPPASPPAWQAELNEHIKSIALRYPDAVEPYTEVGEQTAASRIIEMVPSLRSDPMLREMVEHETEMLAMSEKLDNSPDP